MENLQKDHYIIKQLSTFQNQCINQLKNYSELNNKVETIRNSFFDLTNGINNGNLTLLELENESHKNRHASETAICKSYLVSNLLF